MNKIYPFFSESSLDRLDHIRDNSLEVKKLLDSEELVFLLFDNNSIIVNKKENTCFFTKNIIQKYLIEDNNLILLGTDQNLVYFAVSLKIQDDKNLEKITLRDFVYFDYIPKNKLGIVAQAASVLNWHNTHKFCSFCGKKTVIKKAGWRRDCDFCKKEHFPRLDPVVIMLVTYENYCLIGRGVNFKEKRYSCLAGYVEPGETLENAAKRELFEEAGIDSYDVEYIMSQPWPFPSTLMVGMRMKAKSRKLKLDKNEIEDAIWVHKNDIKAVLNNEKGYSFELPNDIAIARNLLETWIET